MSKIIYTQENGVIAVVHPTDLSLEEMTIEQIAQKVVPVGISTYSIVEDSVIPTDRTLLFPSLLKIATTDGSFNTMPWPLT